ncbi:SMR family transporter [Fusibacter tunisiensis]|uniref:Multidrug transporter EmrE-like cation transporter n=1 Tax=Fusibacter tunisiensis TaxID=1008308 RepID=A0ABS2MSS0_9FIRM|nr:SMR family transporter [Fusibacter tunisiensis]MBM7562441.1 multidrug transporter EmrE-like cation transporter [Fusibacter tunisiensis]
MIYLFLATLCSASIALIFKYTEGSGTNRYAVTTTNYFVAFSTSLLMIIFKGLLDTLSFDPGFWSRLLKTLSSDAGVLSKADSTLWALIIGSIAGAFFFLSFIYYQKSVRENGAGLSGTFAKLGILIPMIFSILLWRELPTALQWIGILLALISIVIVNLSKKTRQMFEINLTLLMLFSFGGIAEFSNKIFQKYALNAYKDVFLFAVFFVAFLISLIYTRLKKSPVTRRDLILGLAVGIPNLFSSYFLILALDTITTSVAFPIYSAGSIVLINLGSLLIYKEHIQNKNKIAIALTLVALVLINL